MINIKESQDPHIQEVYGRILSEGTGPIPHFNILDFVPATGTIVVQRADPEAVTKLGIIIPDGAQEIPNIGRVVVCNQDSDCIYRPGQWVLFRNGGVELPMHGAKNLVALQYRGAIDDEIIGVFVTQGLEPEDSDE